VQRRLTNIDAAKAQNEPTVIVFVGMVQHFLVLSLEDVPGPVPWVLYKVNDREPVRVFSAGPELAVWLGGAVTRPAWCGRESRL
jgi:hypothetical protein